MGRLLILLGAPDFANLRSNEFVGADRERSLRSAFPNAADRKSMLDYVAKQWDDEMTRTKSAALHPAFGKVLQNIQDCAFTDCEMVIQLRRSMQAQVMPLVILGTYASNVLKVTITPSELQPRSGQLRGAERDDPRKMLPHCVLGINIYADDPYYEPVTFFDTHKPAAAFQGPLSSHQDHLEDTLNDRSEVNDPPIKFSDTCDYPSIVFQIGKVYMYDGDYAQRSEGERSKWVDTGYVLVADVTHGRAKTVWMVNNFWKWDENECIRVRREDWEWSGFPGMGWPRASVIHVHGTFEPSSFDIENDLDLKPAVIERELDFVLVRQEENGTLEKELIWRLRKGWSSDAA